MEVKINREIRNYTESMFFGLSLLTVHFFCPCMWDCSGTVFPTETLFRNRNRFMGLYLRCRTICCDWICEIQRDDSREICLGMV